MQSTPWTQILFSLLIVFVLAGCEPWEPKPPEEKEARPLTAREKMRKQYDHYADVLKNAPREDFNDAEQWKEPRFQFYWGSDKRNISTRIYSMKMDGSDIRLAVDRYGLFRDMKSGTSIQKTSRSPNNRYFIGRYDNKDEGVFTGIVDLKERKRKIIHKGYSAPRFAWSPDSSKAYFYSNGGLHVYDVTTEKVTKHAKIRAWALYPLHDGNFIAANSDHYAFIRPDGSEIKRVSVGKDWGSNTRIRFSPSGKTLFYGDGNTCLFNLEKDYPNNKMFCSKVISSVDHLDFVDDEFIAMGPSGAKKFSIRENKKLDPYAPEGRFATSYLRVINGSVNNAPQPNYPY